MPPPELPGLQAAALMIFTAVANAYERDSMSGTLGFFHMEQARIEAEGHGFLWDGDLQHEIHKCAEWYRREIERRQRKHDDNRARREKRQQVN